MGTPKRPCHTDVMDEANVAQLEAELAVVDSELAEPEMVSRRVRFDGPKSMARLTAANVEAFDTHVSTLLDPNLAESLLARPHSASYVGYVERMQHLAANYFLSAVPLLEHLRAHVLANYPDKTNRTRVQFNRGFSVAVDRYDGHSVIVALRNMVAHRQLPTVRLIRGMHEEQQAVPIIDRRELLESSECKGAVRKLLQSLDRNELALDGLVLDDGRFVLEFADWFFRIEALHHSDEFMPMARLLERRERLVARLAPFDSR